MASIILDNYAPIPYTEIRKAVANCVIERARAWGITPVITDDQDEDGTVQDIVVAADADLIDGLLWDLNRGGIGGLRVRCSTDAEYRYLCRDHDGRHYIEDPSGQTTTDLRTAAREAAIDANTGYFEHAVLWPSGTSATAPTAGRS